MNKVELENRLIEFSVKATEYVISLDKHPAVLHLRDQAVRSATAISLNYAEAQSAESKKDFIHKLGIVIKELRETQVNLRMIKRFVIVADETLIQWLLQESDELLAIFHKTIMTAKQNLNN
jgi:four helix bundle protein